MVETNDGERLERIETDVKRIADSLACKPHAFAEAVGQRLLYCTKCGEQRPFETPKIGFQP